jgi:hypothetical protein
MPKAPRFKSKVLGQSPIDNIYNIETSWKFNNYKGAGMGYGSRKPYPQWQ